MKTSIDRIKDRSILAGFIETGKKNLQKGREMKTVSVQVSLSGAEQLIQILKAIGEHGNAGHSYTVVIDPEADLSDRISKVGWDGDGSDYLDIDSIKIQ